MMAGLFGFAMNRFGLTIGFAGLTRPRQTLEIENLQEGAGHGDHVKECDV